MARTLFDHFLSVASKCGWNLLSMLIECRNAGNSPYVDSSSAECFDSSWSSSSQSRSTGVSSSAIF